MGDGLSGPGLRPKPAEHIALKVVAVMYSWFTTGMHVASVGVRSESPACSAISGRKTIELNSSRFSLTIDFQALLPLVRFSLIIVDGTVQV